jgi:hypothetical protein
MSNIYRRILEVSVVVLLLLAGTWIRALAPSHEIPPERDATTALVVATRVESLDTTHWQYGLLAKESFRHRILAGVVETLSPASAQYRNYVFFPLFLSVLFLPLIPCLGWKKHGGVFYTSDGPFWALAFAVVIPVAFMGATSLTPFTFQGMAFLSLLIVARSYALWPGVLSAISMGLITAVAITVSSEVVWGMIFFFLAIVFGVGWSRVTLYWRTSHIIYMLLALGVGLGIAYGCDVLSLPNIPILETDGGALWKALKRQVIWLCVYGVGLFAWGGLVAIAIFRKDSRWERVFAIFFGICFILGVLLKDEVGFVFAVPLSVLTPLMVAVVLTRCPSLHWRWWLGNILLIGLCFGFLSAKKKAPDPLLLEDTQTIVQTTLCPLPKMKDGVDLALLQIEKNETRAQLLWVLRMFASGRHVVYDDALSNNAQVVVIPAMVAQIHPQGYQCIMTITLDGAKAYNVYLKKGDER